MFDPAHHPHRRFNPLRQEWVLVSPHRGLRPWQGAREVGVAPSGLAYDPTCYLCPGNARAGGAHNPPYQGVYVFANDFAALLPDAVAADAAPLDLLESAPVQGECRVICYSPHHGLTLPELSQSEVQAIIHVWQQQLLELGARYAWVQVFENKGTLMGCSNPHPHGQVWASSYLPNELQREDSAQRAYWQTHGRALLLDYAEREAREQQRLVALNPHWLAVVPYWASWPFETLLLPRFAVQCLTQLDAAAQSDLAAILGELTARYDNLFETSFPYSMGWHGAPFMPQTEPPASGLDRATQLAAQPHWQLHAHFYPPLLRSASVRKFMVGFEMLAEPQRDITPEQAAERLRACAPRLGAWHASQRSHLPQS